jgi:hypothetical protein
MPGCRWSRLEAPPDDSLILFTDRTANTVRIIHSPAGLADPVKSRRRPPPNRISSNERWHP